MRLKTLVIPIAALTSIAALIFAAGVRVNTTNSVPTGLYRVVDQPVEIGAVVLVCPPDNAVSEEGQRRGYFGLSADCPRQFQRMFKRVVGTAGMVISTTDDGRLLVDGRVQPASSAMPADSAGRPLARFFIHPTRLHQGQYLVLGDTDRSFDGRYFGPVEFGSIRAVMRPLLTF